MKRHKTALTLVLAFAATLASFPASLSAQRQPTPPRAPGYFAVGLSAGGGALDNNRQFDNWDLGPVFGARIEWFRGQSAWRLYVDAQPFRAGRSNQAGDFRALYVMPAFVAGPPGVRIGLALGAGIFDLTSEFGDDSRKVAFVPSLFGSARISRDMSIEFGWKRIRDVEGSDASFFTLQLVQLFKF